MLKGEQDNWAGHVASATTQALDGMIIAACNWFDKPLDLLFRVRHSDLMLADRRRKVQALLDIEPVREVGGRDDFFVKQHQLGRLPSRPGCESWQGTVPRKRAVA